MTKKEKNLLFILMDDPIMRYILSNIRLDGFEKGQRHIELSTIYVAYKTCKTLEHAKRTEWNKIMKIHDVTAQFTSNLDVEIGLPLDGDDYRLDIVVRKFFSIFLDYCEKNWQDIQKIKG